MMVILITPALEGLRSEWQEAAQSLGAQARLPAPRRGTRGAPVLRRRGADPVRQRLLRLRDRLALVGGTLPLVPAQIDDAINGNVLVDEDRIGLALGVEMIVVILIVMVGYWLVQRRARRWLQ